MSQEFNLIGGRGRELPAILERPRSPGAVHGGLVLAHGAGGSSRTPFIARAGAAFVAAGWAVLRFEFGYATVGGRPGRADRFDAPEHADLRAALGALADALPATAPIVAAGKSYGGRVATFVLAEGSAGNGSTASDPLLARVRGLVVFGYPIAPPSGARPADSAALRSLHLPILIVQGSRDSLGPLDALEAALAGIPHAQVFVVEGGDHSYRAAGGRAVVTRLEDEAIGAALDWLSGLG